MLGLVAEVKCRASSVQSCHSVCPYKLQSLGIDVKDLRGKSTSHCFSLQRCPSSIRYFEATSDAAFGVAFLAADGTGRYSDVFWKRAQELHANSNVDLGEILGSVMAHEMGHLLLGSNAHAINGIMRAHWESGELRRLAMGTLLFLPEQAKRMLGRTAAGCGGGWHEN